MIEGAPENIIWCYGICQSAYDEMLRSVPNIIFVEGVPSDLESMISPSKRNPVVFDDLTVRATTRTGYRYKISCNFIR